MRLSGVSQSSLKAWKIFWTSNFIMKLTDKGLITQTKIYKNSFHQCWHMLQWHIQFFLLYCSGEKKNKNLPRDRIEERMKEKVKTVQFIINHIQFFEAPWIKIKGNKHFLQTTALRYYFGKNISPPPILFLDKWVVDYITAKSSASSTTALFLFLNTYFNYFWLTCWQFTKFCGQVT